MIHKVAIEPPVITERLAGVQLFVLFLLQIYLVQQIQLLASTIAICDNTMMRFIFQFAFLQLQGFSTSASPRICACDNQTLSPCGWGLGTRLLFPFT